LFLKLVGGHSPEGLSVGSKGGLSSPLNLGLLNSGHVNVLLGVWGASEGSGTSFLLLHVNLLDLSSHHVHLRGSLLRFCAVVLVDPENVGPAVDVGLGLGVLHCLDVLHNVVLLSKLHGGEGDGGGELLVVGGEGGVGGELLVVVGEGGGGGELLVNFVLDTSFTSSLPGVHN
jgi:hypothetical protein